MKPVLPESLYKFFWDVEPKNIDIEKSYMYVIERLLDKGDLEAARWVLKNYPKEKIVETLKRRRDFSERTLLYWGNILNIKKEEMVCFQEPFRTMRKLHWQY